MEFAIISLFPKVFEPFITTSIIRKAIENKLIAVKLVNLRDFGQNRRKTVDGKPFGGGGGMVLRADCALTAIEKTAKNMSKPTKSILLTPAGVPFTQQMAENFAKLGGLLIFCGHYQGVDERVANFVDEQVSIGDFILTGGEAGALVVLDAVARKVAGVLPKVASEKESFAQNLLAAPLYTEPVEFRGLGVPQILLSGDKVEIEKWKKRKQIAKTKKLRPDLFEKYLKTANRK